METTQAEFISARKAERLAEKTSIREASAKLQAIILAHKQARQEGTESPLVAMAERIKAREQAGNGLALA